jgi:hypothetical protein
MSIYPSEPTVSVEIEARWGCNNNNDNFERKQERTTNYGTNDNDAASFNRLPEEDGKEKKRHQ